MEFSLIAQIKIRNMRTFLLVLFVLFSLISSNAQYNRAEMRERRQAKKIVQEQSVKCRFVFCGPEIDKSLYSELKDSLDWLSYSEMNLRYLNTGVVCEYCDNLVSLLGNYDNPELYALNIGDRKFKCNTVDCQIYDSALGLQRAMIRDILSHKKSNCNDILIMIPAKSQNDLERMLKEDWSLDKPSNEIGYEKKISTNCIGQEISLYKKKPCADFSNINLVWPEKNDYSMGDGFKFIYAHKGRSNYFFFYINRICSENLKLEIYKEGKLIDSFDVNLLPLDKSDLMYFEIMITRDNFDAPCFTDRCADMEEYELKMKDEETGERKSIGNYKFIHCSK